MDDSRSKSEASLKLSFQNFLQGPHVHIKGSTSDWKTQTLSKKRAVRVIRGCAIARLFWMNFSYLHHTSKYTTSYIYKSQYISHNHKLETHETINNSQMAIPTDFFLFISSTLTTISSISILLTRRYLGTRAIYVFYNSTLQSATYIFQMNISLYK